MSSGRERERQNEEWQNSTAEYPAAKEHAVAAANIAYTPLIATLHGVFIWIADHNYLSIMKQLNWIATNALIDCLFSFFYLWLNFEKKTCWQIKISETRRLQHEINVQIVANEFQHEFHLTELPSRTFLFFFSILLWCTVNKSHFQVIYPKAPRPVCIPSPNA